MTSHSERLYVTFSFCSLDCCTPNVVFPLSTNSCSITVEQRYWELTESSGGPGRGPGTESWQRDFIYLDNLCCINGSFLGACAGRGRSWKIMAVNLAAMIKPKVLPTLMIVLVTVDSEIEEINTAWSPWAEALFYISCSYGRVYIFITALNILHVLCGW